MSLDNINLRKDFYIPLYYQLRLLLLKEIEAGTYAENIPLPTEVELAKKFNISRPTVRQAIGSLAKEGRLTRIKGQGTFVIYPKIKQEFIHEIDSYNSEMIKKGILPTTKVLSFQCIKSTDEISKALALSQGSEVFELSRLRFADQEPIVLSTTYLPQQIFPDLLQKDFTKESLYQVLEKAHISIKKVTRLLEVQLPSKDECELLKIKSPIPLFYFRSTSYIANGTPIEYSIAKYRGDKNKFIIELDK